MSLRRVASLAPWIYYGSSNQIVVLWREKKKIYFKTPKVLDPVVEIKHTCLEQPRSDKMSSQKLSINK
jgi:hypothetical protein